MHTTNTLRARALMCYCKSAIMNFLVKKIKILACVYFCCDLSECVFEPHSGVNDQMTHLNRMRLLQSVLAKHELCNDALNALKKAFIQII